MYSCTAFSSRGPSALLVMALTALPAFAQAPTPAPQSFPVTAAGEPRLMGGASFSVGQPRGAFEQYVGSGFGGSLHGLYRLDPAGALALRVEGGVLNYGRETLRVPLNTSPGGGRVTLDLTTSNDIYWLGVGPQVMVPRGPVRPYVNGTAGLAYFSTTSSVRGRSSGVDPAFAETTNYDDVQLAWGGGAGVLMPVYRNARTLVFLDAGARYHDNGRDVRYLREGGIRDLPDGSIALDVIRSRADFVTWHVGFSVGGR